jgi:alpha-beta hydrolase superfamily lysophospholipase
MLPSCLLSVSLCSYLCLADSWTAPSSVRQHHAKVPNMNAPTSQIVSASGVDCFLWTWSPTGGGAKGLVLLFHGLGAHARFPSVRVAAEALARGGFTVCAPDFAGHGLSAGQRGFIHSAEQLETDALLFVGAAQRAHPHLPLFLAGSSMGGAIAFQAALALGDQVRGLVLLAPMLAPAVSAGAQVL